MLVKSMVAGVVVAGLWGCGAGGGARPAQDGAGPSPAGVVEPLVIGESFTLGSKVLGEVRRVNVFTPTRYGVRFEEPLPVLYMVDGGLDEDFLHVAGLVQVLVSNGGMRPFVLVGVQNTVRRRDMTGPTTNAEDRKIAPVVGGSAAFRAFIKEELMPAVRERYRTTKEAAIVGESLGGLFVLETFFLEPQLFDAYVAIDPSVWWADAGLVTSADVRLGEMKGAGRAVFVATSDEPEMGALVARLSGSFAAHPGAGVRYHHEPFAGETHATVFHPGAMAAFRMLFAPPAEK